MNWGIGIFLIAYHAILAIFLPIYFLNTTASLGLILLTVGLYVCTGLSVTAGYHRYYAHHTYKAHPIVDWVLLAFGTLAGEGSVFRWAYDHRIHHAYVDTDRDPYSIKKGFWYAHVLWLFEKPTTIEPKVISDLLKKKALVFQDRYYNLLFLGSNALVVLLMGWLLNDFFGAIILGFFLRLFIVHHMTWFINSLAHTWGAKPFCQEQSAVNNYLISFVTGGEGYHNYHHAFANDYRNGIRWYHFDPTKWFIWALNKCGLTYDLKRVDHDTIKKRMVIERKKLLLGLAPNSQQIQDISKRLLDTLSTLAQLKTKYRGFKQKCAEKDHLRQELTAFKKRLREEWKLWSQLSQNIMGSKPLAPAQ